VIPLTWKRVDPRPEDDFVVAPDERLNWPRTVGIGAQHVVAMFGATFLVPALTGFPPATTLLFSGLGTLLFLVITGNRLPSYLGSSFSVIAPVTAAVASHGAGSALGGLVAVGLVLIAIGVTVHLVGMHWIEVTLPPVVTGAIVALIGFNLAPAAKTNFGKGPVVGIVTLVLLVAALAFFRGMVGRLAIFLAVVAGYLLALVLGEVDTSAIAAAGWVGLPKFQTPTFTLAVLPMFLPAVIALVAENIGHVKSVGQMTGTDTDPVTGRALAADGLATVLAGIGGHDLRREHRRDGRDASVLDRRVLGGRRGGDRAVAVPEGRRGDLGHPARRARRCDGRALRTGRRARCAHLADQPRRLRPADQPDDRGHRADHRHRRLHVADRHSGVHRHRTRLDRRAGGLPRHARTGGGQGRSCARCR
jgi:Permease family